MEYGLEDLPVLDFAPRYTQERTARAVARQEERPAVNGASSSTGFRAYSGEGRGRDGAVATAAPNAPRWLLAACIAGPAGVALAWYGGVGLAAGVLTLAYVLLVGLANAMADVEWAAHRFSLAVHAARVWLHEQQQRRAAHVNERWNRARGL